MDHDFFPAGELCQGVRVQGGGEHNGAGREGDLQNTQVRFTWLTEKGVMLQSHLILKSQITVTG